MSLTLGLSAWLLIGLGLAAAAGALWLYHRTTPRLDGAMRWVLTGLRFLSLALIVFLLVEPLLTRSAEESDRPVVAVLVDDSQSMTAGGTDAEGVLPREAAEAVIRQLAEKAEIRTFRFGGQVTEGPLDSLTFEAGRTDVASALLEVESALRGQNLAGVVLLSDGRYNAGQNPVHLAGRFPVPIHAVALGDTTERKDIQVRRILTNEVAYRDLVLPMDVGIRHAGYPGERVTVRVSSGGQVLDQEQVVLPSTDGETTVRMEVTPETTGLVRYDVSVTEAQGEFTYRNNSDAISVRVLESRRRILVLAGAPSPDLTAITASLDAGDDAELSLFVRKPAGGYFQGAFPDPSQFDLAVLVGYPSAGTAGDDLDRLASAISGGVEALFVLDYATDLQLMQRLGTALPVVPRVLRTGRSEGAPVLTPAGLRHPILDLPDDLPANTWAQLPPLTVSDVTWQTAPDATVLATTSIRGIALDDPLLVIRSRSGGRSAAVLAYGLWRWRNLPESLSRFDPVLPTLLENLTRWLAAPEDDRPVRIRPARLTFEGGEEIEFFGQVYNDSAQPITGAEVRIQVRSRDGTLFPFTMRSIGSGRYRAGLGTLPEGTYSYEGMALQDEVELGTDNGSFSVGPLALEFKETRADAALMRQVAVRSGGSFGVGSGAERVGAAVASSPQFQSRTRVVESSIRLWQRYPFLLLVLVLLTVEWLLRKRRGLV